MKKSATWLYLRSNLFLQFVLKGGQGTDGAERHPVVVCRDNRQLWQVRYSHQHTFWLAFVNSDASVGTYDAGVVVAQHPEGIRDGCCAVPRQALPFESGCRRRTVVQLCGKIIFA